MTLFFVCFGYFDVFQNMCGKWEIVGISVTGKVPRHLHSGCLCLSDLGLSMSLDTLMYYLQIYISFNFVLHAQ